MNTTSPPPPAAGRRNPDRLHADHDLSSLERLRWAVRAVLLLGVAASIAANVLHAHPNLISQLIAAWPPLALLLTVELISRVPADRHALAAVRLIAAGAIAGIAGWVSYWHMAGVAARYGETGAAASYLLPISVDGLVVVASISLVEIAGRIRTSGRHPHLATTAVHTQPAGGDQRETCPLATELAAAPSPAAATASRPAPLVPPSAVASVERAPTAAHHLGAATSARRGVRATLNEPARHGVRRDRAGAGDRALSNETVAVSPGPAPADDSWQPAADDLHPAGSASPSAGGAPGTAGDNLPAPSGRSGPDRAQSSPATASEHRRRPGQPGLDAAHADVDARKDSDQGDRGHDDAVVPSDTAAAVAYWHDRDPSLHPAEIAARIGRSERTVRRYWPPNTARTANGNEASRLAEQVRAL